MMPWPSRSIKSFAGRAGLTASGGGAGLFGALAISHKPSAVLAAAAVLVTALIANGLARVVESLYKRRPEIIKAKGEAHALRIAALGEAEALIIRAQARRDLLRAGIETDKPEQITEMLRQQSLGTDMPPGRRLNDEALAKLLAAPKISITGRKPAGGTKAVVIPIRPDD
jgi:hypothetical protein